MYRWWSTKAEILLEACTGDIGEELATAPRPDPAADLRAYLDELSEFLTDSPAGLSYRALIRAPRRCPPCRSTSTSPACSGPGASRAGGPGANLAPWPEAGPADHGETGV